MLLAALRRFALLLVVIALGTAVFALVLGAAIGASATRSLSVGFYLVGSFLMLSGFFIGNRGPVRARGEGLAGPLAGRAVRWATATEQDETLNSSALFVTLGLGLILLGVFADTRYKLF